MSKKMIIILASITLAIIPFFGTQDALGADDSIRAELKQARNEIQQLRKEMDQLKSDKSWQYKKNLKSAMKNPPALTNNKNAKGGLELPAGWTIVPYGYLKFDVSYDDSSTTAGNYVVWAKSENSTNRNNDKLSATARQSRFGAKIFAPNINDISVMGRVEIDFYNGKLSQENKATPVLRHAYAQLTGNDWHFIFGQTADIISPLVPTTINYTVGWLGGNIGYRHPQLQFAKWWQCDQGCKFKIETAISRQIGQDADGLGVDDGHDTSTPSILGRISYAAPLAGKKLVAGLSGHYGTEEIDTVTDDISVNSWSLNADLVVPLSKQIELKGEVFWSENADSYFAGIGQGVNDTTMDEIESMGGWAQIGYKPSSSWAFYTGGGIDDPINSDLNDDDKTSNLFAYTNANYFFSKYLSTGMEVSYYETGYKNSGQGKNYRFQHAWKLSF